MQLVNALSLQARYGEAIAWDRTAAGFIDRLGLEGSTLDADRLGERSELLVRMGKRDEALAVEERAQSILLAELGPLHPRSLWAVAALGGVQSERGELAESLRRSTEALALGEQILGPRHPDLAAVLDVLGSVHLRLGHADAAEAVYERELELLRMHYPDDHPDVIGTQMNLGNVLVARGEYAQAREIFERVLPMRIAQLGADHPGVADTLSNIGSTLGAEGKHAAAVEVFERAHAIRRAKLAADHPTLVVGLEAIGRSYSYMGEHEQGIATLREAMALADVALAADDPHRLELRRYLADALRRGGQRDAAIVELEVNAAAGDVLADHWLAELQLEAGRLDEAQRRYGRAVEGWRASAGEASLEYGDAIAGLGKVALARADIALAITELERALPILEAHPEAVTEIAQARFALARALVRRDHSRARDLATAARDAMATLGPDMLAEHSHVVEWLAAHR
jgi:tetratricopeptide (TPR) repeat protein